MGMLGKIFSSANQIEIDRTVSPTSVATRERIKNILGIRELESMPAQAARAFQLSSDPRASLNDFTKIIESDEALVSRIIRIANSVYFYRGTPADDIEKSVTNIGLTELRGLLSATMLRSLTKSKHPIREVVWKHSVSTGMFTRYLARQTNNISEGEAFLGGILHDIGKLVMISKNPQGYAQVVSLQNQGIASIEAEEKIFKVNHVDVGKWVAQSWNFPPKTIQAIAFHHEPWPVDNGRNSKQSLPFLVKAASALSHASGVAESLTYSKSQPRNKNELLAAFSFLELDEKAGSSLLDSLRKIFQEEYGSYEMENTP